MCSVWLCATSSPASFSRAYCSSGEPFTSFGALPMRCGCELSLYACVALGSAATQLSPPDAVISRADIALRVCIAESTTAKLFCLSVYSWEMPRRSSMSENAPLNSAPPSVDTSTGDPPARSRIRSNAAATSAGDLLCTGSVNALREKMSMQTRATVKPSFFSAVFVL